MNNLKLFLAPDMYTNKRIALVISILPYEYGRKYMLTTSRLLTITKW